MNLLQISLSGTMMIIVIIIIRALTLHRLPKKTFSVLWDVVLIRLLIPYSLPSVFSAYSLLGYLFPAAEMKIQLQTVPVIPATQTANTGSNFIIYQVNPWKIIWIMGALVLGIYFALTYRKCLREFRESLPADGSFVKHWLDTHRLRRTIQIRQSGKISAPLTYGILRPVILLPKAIDGNAQESLQYILAHEYIHIRRFDALTKLVLTVALCIHWFNLAVWVMYILVNRDMELSCDEAVVRLFGERAKSAYALTLIRMEEVRNDLMSLLYSNFSKNAIQERIIAIMKIKKTSWAAITAAVVLTVIVSVMFATSASAHEKNIPDVYRKDAPVMSMATFCYEQDVALCKTGDAVVNPFAFVNTEPAPIDRNRPEDARERARNECTIEYNAISMSYDQDNTMWKVEFRTIVWQDEGPLKGFPLAQGECQTVYLDHNGITKLIVYNVE